VHGDEDEIVGEEVDLAGPALQSGIAWHQCFEF
jgi:hypothetical protein